MQMSSVIGVDLGGTNVRAQAVFPDGRPAGERVEMSSHAQDGVEIVIEKLSDTINLAIKNAEVEPTSVGLAIPGHVDDDAGVVVWAPNFGKYVDGVFRYWENVEIKAEIERRTGKPLTMGNDANAAALGEYLFGLGEGKANCLVMLTLGTGIGGGVVFAPKSIMGPASGPLVLIGGNKGGGELGHMVVQHNGMDCNAGSYGTIEAYCQRDSIVRRATHKLRRGRKSIINDLVKGELGKVTPAIIDEAADHGDSLAREVWQETGMFLGVGVGSLINVFAPDVFAIGGQISKAGRWFMESAIDEARNVAVPSLYADCEIELAKQVDDAGLLGGAALALQKSQS
ncbi:MAG: ROK family protein [Fimbriimonadaceae bacterium]